MLREEAGQEVLQAGCRDEMLQAGQEVLQAGCQSQEEGLQEMH